MAEHIDDGGAAFPSIVRIPAGSFDPFKGRTLLASEPAQEYVQLGASLRDYFAAKAMHAHLITDTVPGEACDALVDAAALAGRDPLDHLCINAYEVADAMLRARKVVRHG